MSQTPFVQPSHANPPRLTLSQFLQTVIVGISNIDGSLVRPKWQPEPPKQPDIGVNWIAMGIEVKAPDANAWVAPNQAGILATQRHQDVQISLSIYGPNDLDTYDLIVDGFQIDQNRITLFNANMGFTEISPARRIPDLVNQRWIDRVECTVALRREVQRTYPVPTILSANGIIYVPDISTNYQKTWSVHQ